MAHRYNADCGRLFPRKVLLLLGDSAALTRGFSGYEEARSLPLPGPSFPPVKHHRPAGQANGHGSNVREINEFQGEAGL